jgi:hypothetical protein
MIVGNIEVYYVNKAIDIFVKNKNNYILKETKIILIALL